MNNEVTEILEGIRAGHYRMDNCKYAPLKRLRVSPELPKGEWITFRKYHPNTIRAAQRRMVYQFNADTLTGHYIIK